MQQDPLAQFQQEAIDRGLAYKNNATLQAAKQKLFEEINKSKYAYNFFWLGRPIIQIPQDLQALQEIIWQVKPDLIIETGIAWGGSIIFSASMLTLLEACGEIAKGEVIGIDIDIREHNKKAILAHPLSKKITMFEGSSVDESIVNKVTDLAKNKKRILLCLDSNHTHNHVLAELKAYAPLVSVGSYCIVADTGIEDLPVEALFNRPWGGGDNPKTAIDEFFKDNNDFEVDDTFEAKFIFTSAPGGYLRRIK